MARQSWVTGTVGGEPLSEILIGEIFEVLELSRRHAWGVSSSDGAVGFVPADALTAPVEVSHIVGLAGDPALPVGSRIGADAASQVDAKTLQPLAAPIADYVAVAEALVGTAFATGGRSGAGVDAPGLVVLALSLAGIAAPRFVDLQAATLGHAVGTGAPMLRGDLIFFADHVAIAVDDVAVVHASPTGVERQAIAGLDYGPIVARRRLP